MSVSRLTRYKGIHVLIEAFLSNNYENMTLLIVGDCGLNRNDEIYKNSLINYAKSDSRIKFLGWRNDVDALMHISDIFIAPAVEPDPFPTTILEAMNSSSCCIVSNVGGQPEAVNNSSGLIFEPGMLKNYVN